LDGPTCLGSLDGAGETNSYRVICNTSNFILCLCP
jgi:hypothetical protein